MLSTKQAMTEINLRNQNGDVIASLQVPAMSVDALFEFQDAWQRRPDKPKTRGAYVRAFKRAYAEAYRDFEQAEAARLRIAETLLNDRVFRGRLRGEFALQCVNGAGVQEVEARIPEHLVEWMRAFDEASKWHGRGKAA